MYTSHCLKKILKNTTTKCHVDDSQTHTSTLLWRGKALSASCGTADKSFSRSFWVFFFNTHFVSVSLGASEALHQAAAAAAAAVKGHVLPGKLQPKGVHPKTTS